ERIALRVLPMLDSLSKALELGYKPANIICMQGPFSELLNIEMMRKYNSRYLVTKDSGSIGGFEEKAQAAAKAGAKLIVIARNGKEFGTGYSEIVKLLKDRYGSGK
ncbi:precorrin-6A/cobalt-precorrin-6A reductase, partial [Phascolarctobacterium faecium]